MYTKLAARAIIMVGEGTSLNEAAVWITRHLPKSLQANARCLLKREAALAIML